MYTQYLPLGPNLWRTSWSWQCPHRKTPKADSEVAFRAHVPYFPPLGQRHPGNQAVSNEALCGSGDGHVCWLGLPVNLAKGTPEKTWRKRQVENNLLGSEKGRAARHSTKPFIHMRSPVIYFSLFSWSWNQNCENAGYQVKRQLLLFLSDLHYCCCLAAKSCLTLLQPPRTIACQASPSMEFSKQEYWSGILFPPPGDLPDPGI